MKKSAHALGTHTAKMQSVVKPTHLENRTDLNQDIEVVFKLHQDGQLDEAASLCREILKMDSHNFQAHRMLAMSAIGLGDHRQATESLRSALELDPQNLELLFYQGNEFLAQNNFPLAIHSYDQVLQINPSYFRALNNRGNAYRKLRQSEIALRDYNSALEIKPDYVEALNNRGSVLLDLNRTADALTCFEAVLSIRPDYLVAFCNRARALMSLNRNEDALDSYNDALEINPYHADALHGKGNVLRNLMRLNEAKESYKKALDVAPDLDFLYGIYIYTARQVCDWDSIEEQMNGISKMIECGEHAFPPFAALALLNSRRLQRKAADIWVKAKHTTPSRLAKIINYPRHKRIRIGYFSPDFRRHPLSYLLAEMFELHDKSRFETFAFAFGPDTTDEMRERLVGAFDHFINVRTQSDIDVAILARNLEIDVAVDLTGFTQNSRTEIFNQKVAPVQVNYMGYPGTMAAEFIDYLIADPILIPETDRQDYSEKIAYLPNCYMANDSKRMVADRNFARAELGLPADGFVFCCFNNNYKITPDTFDCWMRILQRVKTSVLWLFKDNDHAALNLKKEAASRGVDPERIVFADRMNLADHLARHRAADLLLDTLPYNAHTTASDALWVGLPILTLPGETFASRVASSLLTAIGVPELITTSLEEYEETAIELANNPTRLAQIKSKIIKNRLTTPLFDCRRFTRDMESLYAIMYERDKAGLPPDHIILPSPATLIGVENLRAALSLHQQGKDTQAEALYLDILKNEPNNFNALQLLGTLYMQRTNSHAALERFEKALFINPLHAQTHFNRGNCLLQLNRHTDAITCFSTSVKLDPDYFEAHYNCGCTLFELKQFETALQSFDDALRIRPDHPLACYNRGNVLRELGRPDEAIASYDRAVLNKSDYDDALNNKGTLLINMGRVMDAIDCFKLALEINPDNSTALYNLANALRDQGDFIESLTCYSNILARYPTHLAAVINRGTLLIDMGRFDDALQNYTDASAKGVESVGITLGIGNALASLQRYEDAIEYFMKVLSVDNTNVQALNNLGKIYHDTHQFDMAFQTYGRAIQICPDYADALSNSAYLYLNIGEYKRGFELYEWRFKAPGGEVRTPSYIRKIPRWCGKSPIGDKAILLYAEQGYGDTLMFCRYIKKVADLGARIYLHIPPALRDLLRSLQCKFQILSDGESISHLDFQVSIMSLPYVFGTTLESIPANIPYLSADRELSNIWNARLGLKHGLRVGVAWGGNPVHKNDKNRSISLSEFSKLLLTGIDYVCLQKELRPADIVTASQLDNLHLFEPYLTSFAETAAMLEHLDLVICVDTSIAHLAGAMGKPVWMLLPFNADWRWLVDRDTSPWYPTMKLYRQKTMGHWSGVINCVCDDLRQLSAAYDSSSNSDFSEDVLAFPDMDAG